MSMTKEIERKWLVDCLPSADHIIGGDSPVSEVEYWNTEQAYLALSPQVRIRSVSLPGGLGDADYYLTFKGPKTANGLSRTEIETPYPEEQGKMLFELCGFEPIHKWVNFYYLKDGHKLEFHRVDPNTPLDKAYAEVEFADEAEARDYVFPFPECNPVDVTSSGGVGMGDYWIVTRLLGIRDRIAWEPKMARLLAEVYQACCRGRKPIQKDRILGVLLNNLRIKVRRRQMTYEELDSIYRRVAGILANPMNGAKVVQSPKTISVQEMTNQLVSQLDGALSDAANRFFNGK